MFLLLCIDRVVVDAAVSFRGSSMIITQYGALSMHALENCVNHPLLMVELSTYHDGLTIGACLPGAFIVEYPGIKKEKQTSKCIQRNNKLHYSGQSTCIRASTPEITYVALSLPES